MATIKNLRIVVDADIGSAIVKLQDLQEELEDVANKIRGVRNAGRRGISVRTSVDDITDDLGRLATEIKAFEMAHGIDIGTNVGGMGGLSPSAAGAAMGGVTGRGNTPRGTSTGFGTLLRGIRDSRGGGLSSMLSSLTKTLGDFNEESSLTNINMSDMHNLLARLIPLLVVFIGALPAAITAMVGLAAAGFSAAAALAAIAGFGALGVAMEDGQFNMDNLTELFEQIRDDFLHAFTPLANQLEPLFRDAADGLGEFFRAVSDEGDALLELTDDARAFGRFLIDFVPQMLRTMAAMANSMGDVFGNIGGFLRANFEPAMRSLMEVTVTVLPVVSELILSILRAVPAITRLSAGFALVTNVIIQVLGAVGRLISLFGISYEALGILLATMLTGISVFALGSAVIGSTFVTALYGAATAAISATYNIAVMIASMLGLGKASLAAAAATAALWTVLSLGLAIGFVGFVSAMTSEFTSLAGSIDGAANSMKEFNRVSNGTGGVGFGNDSPNPYAYTPDSGGGDSYTVESSGDPEEDRSNIQYASWQSGRTTFG